MDAWLANQQGGRALQLAKANARFLSRDPEFMRKSIRIALAQGCFPQICGSRDISIRGGNDVKQLLAASFLPLARTGN